MVCLTDREWEFLQGEARDQLVNMPMNFHEFEEDNLGESIMARLAVATTVDDPDPVQPGEGAPQIP